MGLFTEVTVAIDGSKFKAVNNRDQSFTRAKMERRLAQIEESVARYLQQLDSADRQEPSPARTTKTGRLKEKIANLKEEMQRLRGLEARMLAAPERISLTDPDARSSCYTHRRNHRLSGPALLADQAKLSQHTAWPGMARTCGTTVKLATPARRA
jgi:hypothetical protein